MARVKTDWDLIKFLPVADNDAVLALKEGDLIEVEGPRGLTWRVGWNGGRRYRQSVSVDPGTM